jgi:diketogulonate reductase-like aldo/keto reductase
MSKNLSFRLNDGTHIPWLGFGTGSALYGRDARNSVKVAIEHGISLLDGAQWYSNEDSLGAGIKDSGKNRSDLYILTKLKMLGEGDTVESLLRGSLEKLGVDYVDLFLIHSPLPYKGRLKEVWKDMEALQKAGLAKSIGVSNFSVDHLNDILDDNSVVPAVNQVRACNYMRSKKGLPITNYRLNFTPMFTRLLRLSSSLAKSMESLLLRMVVLVLSFVVEGVPSIRS